MISFLIKQYNFAVTSHIRLSPEKSSKPKTIKKSAAIWNKITSQFHAIMWFVIYLHLNFELTLKRL